MKKKEINIDESWRNVLRKMAKSELILIVYNHKDYAPHLLEMAKDVLKKVHGMTEEEILSITDTDYVIEGKMGTRALFLEILRQMGCGQSIDFDNDDYKDDGKCDFSFSYLGKSFYAYAVDERVYVEIDRPCYYVNLEDKEKVERAKNAVNKVNSKCYAGMYYEESEKLNDLVVSCYYVFLFIPLIPNIESYLHHQINIVVKAEQAFLDIINEDKHD